MKDNFDDITIALAGMLQAVALVRELTQTGKNDPAAFEASINSIFRMEAKTASDVFGGLAGVKTGLEKILFTFDATQMTDRLQNRYLLSLIHLQKKLSRSPKTLQALMKRLQQTQKQVNYFSVTHSVVISNLADIYLNTISTFRFRIVILGTHRVLQVKENMEKVRALLLAGVRAAVLWKQMGGSRLQIIFLRAKIKASAEKLLAQIKESAAEASNVQAEKNKTHEHEKEPA
jgi:high frequency lysogenization protein